MAGSARLAQSLHFLLCVASELTTARFRLKTYSSIPQSNELVARLAYHAARRWHIYTWGIDSIEDRVRHATVTEPTVAEVEEPAPLAQGPDRDEDGTPRAGSDGQTDCGPSSTMSAQLPHQSQQKPDPSSSVLFSSSDALSSVHDPPALHIFTRALSNVFCAWLNQHEELENVWKAMDESELKLVVEEHVAGLAVFLSCLRLEAGAFWCWNMWQGALSTSSRSPP